MDLKKNTGFIELPIEIGDFQFGAIPLEDRNLSGNWADDLPSDERQSNDVTDYMNCVSQSANNVLETQANFFLRNNKIPLGLFNWCKAQGYIENDKFNFSDCFTGKMSGTSKYGNGVKPVWDSIRHNGLLPEKDWHKTSDQLSWDKYYENILQNLKDKALSFMRFFDVSYQWVSAGTLGTAIGTIKDALKHSPLQLAAPTCSPWSGGVIPSCSAPANHATEIYACDDTIHDFDTYPPFRKQLALDYPTPYLMQGILSIKTFELTTEMARYAWLKREDLQIAFTAHNKFYQKDSDYSLYDWCREYGTYEMPEVFIDSQMDWAKINTANYPDYEQIEVPTIKKKVSFWEKVKAYLSELFK